MNTQANTDLTPSATLAIAPFLNIGSSQDERFLSEGLSRVLADTLSGLPGLRVLSVRTSFQMAASAAYATHPEAAAAFQLEGSVRRYSGKVALTLSLSSREHHYQLWSESYEQDEYQLLTLIDTACLDLAHHLREHCGHFHSEPPLFTPGTSSVKAFEYYLLGLYRLHLDSPEGFRTGLDYLEAAIEEDAAFADAYTEAALGCYRYLSTHADDVEGIEQRALAFAEQAVAFPHPGAKAYLAAGLSAYTARRDFPEAMRLLNESLLLNPGLSDTYLVFARVCLSGGHFTQAAEALNAAQAIDPLCAEVHFYRAYLHYLQGAFHSAKRFCDAALNLNGGYTPAIELKIAALIMRGYETELNDFLRYLPGNMNRYRLLFRLVHDQATDVAEVEHWLKSKPGNASFDTRLDWSVYLNLYAGNAKFAIAGTEAALLAHTPASLFYRHDPFLKPLRNHTEFRVILDRYLPETPLQAMHVPQKSREGLYPEDLADTIERIARVMEEESLYTDPKLSLESYADRLLLDPNTLSFCLSEHMHVTFAEWVKEKRLKRFEELQRSGQDKSVLALAFESGFPSKYAFQHAFSEKYGMSAEAWIRVVGL